MNGQRLRDIIDVDDIQSGKLNLIEAPCGSGKTTFAKEELKGLALYDILYLIDTATGKEQLLHSAEVQYNHWTEEPYWKLDGITVMTYAGYATLHKLAPERDYWKHNAVIVCDELHNPIQWSKWSNDYLHSYALGLIALKINIGNNIVIAISATADKIREEFNYCLNEIELHGDVFHYEDANTEYFNNMQLVINKITTGQKGIIYTPHIRDIIKYQQQLENKGIKAAGIWSINNKEHGMSEQQRRIRDYIISYQKIPSDIDVLLINKSSETSINIKSDIDFMIIHSSDDDTQTQARGRYRNDLKQLYLYDGYAEDDIILDEKWLNRPLYKDDKNMLCEELGLRENGRSLKWPKVKESLLLCGYKIDEKKIKGGARYTMINK